jgi:hypothetical protein
VHFAAPSPASPPPVHPPARHQHPRMEASEQSDDVCVICLSSITERAITAPCNHYSFDFICLVSWLQEKSTCPLCMSPQIVNVKYILTVFLGKAEVASVQYDFRSPTDFKNFPVQSTRPPLHPPRARLPRRPYASRRPYPPPTPDVALLRRRYVYSHKLFSLYVGSNRISQYRNLTPEMVASSPDLQSRAKAWIRRELRVFSFLHTDPEGTPSDGATTSSSAEFLLTYIVSILKTVDIKASNGHAEDLLQEFLGRENTRLFLHELNAWLRSPFARLQEWDRNVQYTEPLPDTFDDEGRPVQDGKMRRRSRSPGPARTQYRERDGVRQNAPG